MAAVSAFGGERQQPVASKGVLDLSGWDFYADSNVELRGEWEFYWNQLLPPAYAFEMNKEKKTGFMSLPGSWNGYKINGKSISGEGYATFRLRVLLKNVQVPLAFKFGGMYSAYAF